MNVVGYGQKETLFIWRHTNFQPKQTISLRLAGVRTKCSRKNGERGIPCSDKTFPFKEVEGCTNQSQVRMKTLHQRWRPFHRLGKWWPLFFWVAQGIIIIYYLQKGQTITGKYYATLLSHLHEKLRKKHLKLAHERMLFHQNNISHTHTHTLSQFQWQKCIN